MYFTLLSLTSNVALQITQWLTNNRFFLYYSLQKQTMQVGPM